MTLSSPNNTLNAIQTKVRRLTASASEQILSTSSINEAINTFYNNDFPYAIKLDQMRGVYTFYTSPNIDRYPLDVNMNQGIRSPIYFEGINGYFFKDRKEFFNMWPRWPSLSNPFSGDGVTQTFNFTVSTVPFLSKEFTLGVMGTNGNQINVFDDGNGNLLVQFSNSIVLQPPSTSTDPIPGMKNNNLSSGSVPYSSATFQTFPGDDVPIIVGTVNYVTGAVSINFALASVTPASGALANLWVSQYTVGRPYSLLFWNNELTIRPVPDKTYKVEVETYMTPVQFLENNSIPTLVQWWQYIAYGSAMEILRERQDMEGLENLREGFMRQEALVLERQSVEEINQRNATLFSGTTPQQGWNQGIGWPY